MNNRGSIIASGAAMPEQVRILILSIEKRTTIHSDDASKQKNNYSYIGSKRLYEQESKCLSSHRGQDSLTKIRKTNGYTGGDLYVSPISVISIGRPPCFNAARINCSCLLRRNGANRISDDASRFACGNYTWFSN
jgi:hypothetical protein